MKRLTPIQIILIIVILVGVFARFNQLDAHFLNGDEEFYLVAAEKFHAGSDYDPRLWNYHNPPVAKYLWSLSLAGTDVDYSIPYAIPPNLWVWNYVAYESISQVYPLVRGVSAVAGALFVLFIFLIGRELFDRTAGLWAAASAAIAIDFIILSRVAMLDIFLYLFIASTMFFYIKYRRSDKPIPWLVVFLISLVLMFGSKNAQWLVVIPPLLYVEIVANKKRVFKTVNFLIVLGIAWFIHSNFIYPPEFSDLAYEFFTTGANRNVFEPHLNVFFTSLVSINSYLYTAVFALTVLVFIGSLGLYHKRIDWHKIRQHLLFPNAYSFVIFVAMVSLVVFSLTSLSTNSKYIGQTSIPFFVLGGLVIQRLWGRSKILQGVLVVLLLVGAGSALYYAPSYEAYPGQQVIHFSAPSLNAIPEFAFLENQGNPPVITNDLNVLIFYEGQALALPVVNSPSCTPELQSKLVASGFVGIFKNIGEVERTFVCPLMFEYEERVLLDPDGGTLQSILAVRY